MPPATLTDAIGSARRRSRLPVVAIAALLLASACGGGGSSGSSFAPGPSPSPAPTPPATTPAPSPPVGGFATGTFEAPERFEAFCASPRTGIDPQSGAPWPDRPGVASDENEWLRAWSHDLYLWFDEIDDVDPVSLPTPDYFDVMKTFETTSTGAPKDRFHFTQPTDEFRAFSQSGVRAGYGAEFAILAPRAPRSIRVAFVQSGSQAERAGVRRGDTLVEVDGVDAVSASEPADIDVLNAALFPDAVGVDRRFRFLDRDTGDPYDVDLVSENAALDPVQTVRVLDTASGPVGYLLFTDHIAPAEAALAEAVTGLSDAGVEDLVLDLRYNGGGLLAIAAELGYMIAGPARANGQVFETLEFNAKHTVLDPVTGARLEPDLFPATARGFSLPSGQALPNLDLPRVFVLTGPGTCSASESLMNSLLGIGVEVIQLGAATCGKPYGFYPTDNCGTTYFSIQFRGVNALGWGDYADGFLAGREAGPAGEVAGCVVDDDFEHDLGDAEEARLAAALGWRETGSCPAAPLATASPAAGVARFGPTPAVREPPWYGGSWRLRR